MTYQDDGWVRVTAYMPPEVVAAVDEAGRRDRRSRAEMIRLAVESVYLPDPDAAAKRPELTNLPSRPDLRPLVGAGPPKPAAPSRHAFTPRDGNALRCATCGAGKAGHKP